MLLMEIHQLKKYYGDRLIIDIAGLKIYDRDKIGLIGLNGAGKTTLLDIITGALSPDEGYVKIHGPWSYITQIDNNEEKPMSGGERTLAKIEVAFGKDNCLLLADEPTSNLSIGHIESLTSRLHNFKGALLVISHDRALLNEVCNKIIEIENGHITEYSGNYTFYIKEKEAAGRRKQEDYEKYVKEKEHLTHSVRDIKQKANSMKKAPKRMGNSEARLHKNSIKERAKKVDGTSRAIEARLEMLEEVKKPVIPSRTRIDIQEGRRIYAKLAVEATGLTKSFGERVIFQNASFKIATGSKTALIGENGAGKTTLVKMIMNATNTEASPNEAHGSIKLANNLEIAYFSQDLDILDENMTIYDNVAEGSVLSQTQIRSILSRMLFYRDDVFKMVSVLSGGEQVKVALAKIFSRNVNMLILDEPNNYLDIYSMEALEGLITDYEGTILMVTHDKSLIDLADRLLVIEGGVITSIDGGYGEKTSVPDKCSPAADKNALIQRELRLAEIIGRLSVPGKSAEEIERLDQEYKLLSAELRTLREQEKNTGTPNSKPRRGRSG